MDTHKHLILSIQKEVKKRLKGESTGHDYWHCRRVVKMALKIGTIEKADLQVLEISGWLHDIGVMKGRKNHEIRSAKITKAFLTKKRLDLTLIEKVCKNILHHRFTTGKVETLEDKVLQDADKLDVTGAMGIARCFSFAGHYKKPFYTGTPKTNSEKYLKTGKSTSVIDHFYDKVTKLEPYFHTKTGREIGKERIDFIKLYMKHFLQEWNT